ncbi:MAG: PTS sugar transporter subunit IIA [Burkholderiales bacterium]|nr:PTS fructose transporter subunit IIA [Burkholderiales bacterium]MDQ3195317.1 PTS fructose transporter subunit IIA [Pseudomonadota bacterium]
MVGILIIAHGDLGLSLIRCATHVMGAEQPHLQQVGVKRGDDPQRVMQAAQAMLKQLDQGDGVLILSDIYGATPCNAAGSLLVPGKVEGVAGVSLPMLVRALCHRGEPLADVVQRAISGGHEGVIDINKDPCHA